MQAGACRATYGCDYAPAALAVFFGEREAEATGGPDDEGIGRRGRHGDLRVGYLQMIVARAAA
jgi:hypothetical protein